MSMPAAVQLPLLNDRKSRRALSKNGSAAKLDEIAAELGIEHSLDALSCLMAITAKLHAAGKTLSNSAILVLFGGGKDSSFAVAFCRAVQLMGRDCFGETFRMRVATFRHPGMAPRAVMQNIDTIYSRLDMHDDPDVELIVIDGEDVAPFDLERPIPVAARQAARRSMLMAAHRSGGDPRSSFCDRCNLHMTRAFRQAAAYGRPVDLIVTGDSAGEQARYSVWVKKAADRFAVAFDGEGVGLTATLNRLDQLHATFDTLIEGDAAPGLTPLPTLDASFPEFFSLYEYTPYDLGSHRRFVEEYLGFVFDPTVWFFTESDCANPALMAIMRGLLLERVRGRTFAEGFAEYADFALNLMRRKNIPDDLIDVMAERVRDVEGFRAAALTFLREGFDLDERQLVATLFSPFTDAGARLGTWIAAEAPDLGEHKQQIRALASGESEGPPELVAALAASTALDLASIRHLWRAALTPNLADPGSAGSALAFIRKGDPHKAAILTPMADGELRREIITGR